MPEPVFTVTVRVVPEPLTPVMATPVTPVVVRVKSLNGALVFTPVTASENVIMKPTLDAFVGFVLASIIEETTGIVIGVWVAVGVKVGVFVAV